MLSWRSELDILFDVLGLSEEQLPFVQQCKEEEISDSEFIESNCDEENEDQTFYPSESVVEEWKQTKEKRTDYKESLKQGHCLFIISFTKNFSIATSFTIANSVLIWRRQMLINKPLSLKCFCCIYSREYFLLVSMHG